MYLKAHFLGAPRKARPAMKVETIKQSEATANVDEKYGGYKDARLVKQHNRRICVLRTNSNTYSIHVRSLVIHDGKPKIMRSCLHLTEEAMLGVIQAVISLDGRDRHEEASHE